MSNVLERAKLLFNYALPKFDWGKSALDAKAITLLNEVPGEIIAALTPPKTKVPQESAMLALDIVGEHAQSFMNHWADDDGMSDEDEKEFNAADKQFEAALQDLRDYIKDRR